MTGSLAIIKYQEALGISSDLVTNDVDILIVCKGHPKLWNIDTKKKIGDYKKVQKQLKDLLHLAMVIIHLMLHVLENYQTITLLMALEYYLLKFYLIITTLINVLKIMKKLIY